MGIKKSEGGKGNLIFLDIDTKAGVFKQGKQAMEPNISVEGFLKKFSVRAENFEYNGQKIYKESLQLRLQDTEPGAPDIQVSLTLATGGDPEHNTMGDPSLTALVLLGKLNAADLSQPIEIKPWSVAKGQKFGEGTAEKDMAGVAIKQGGASIKEDYGNGLNRLPELQPVMANGRPVVVQGKAVKDKAPWNLILDQVLDQLTAKLPAMAQEQKEPASQELDPGEAGAAAEAAMAAGGGGERAAMRARG